MAQAQQIKSVEGGGEGQTTCPEGVTTGSSPEPEGMGISAQKDRGKITGFWHTNTLFTEDIVMKEGPLTA